jgi:hypothetical protein
MSPKTTAQMPRSKRSHQFFDSSSSIVVMARFRFSVAGQRSRRYRSIRRQDAKITDGRLARKFRRQVPLPPPRSSAPAGLPASALPGFARFAGPFHSGISRRLQILLSDFGD